MGETMYVMETKIGHGCGPEGDIRMEVVGVYQPCPQVGGWLAADCTTPTHRARAGGGKRLEV